MMFLAPSTWTDSFSMPRVGPSATVCYFISVCLRKGATCYRNITRFAHNWWPPAGMDTSQLTPVSLRPYPLRPLAELLYALATPSTFSYRSPSYSSCLILTLIIRPCIWRGENESPGLFMSRASR